MAFGNGAFLQDPSDASANSAAIIKIVGLTSALMTYTNGTTERDTVKGGTIIGKITATGKGRPVGKAVLTAISTASTTVTVGTNNIKTLLAGDAVKMISKLGLLGTVTAADLDGTPSSGESVDLQGVHLDGLAHKVIIVDPSANSSALLTSVTFDNSTGIETLSVSLQTDGSGVGLTTITELINQINLYSNYTSAELTAGATGSTVIDKATAATFTLAGALAVGGSIATGLSIVSTAAAGTMVLDAAVTAAVGDYVATEDGSDVAVGILTDFGGVTFLPAVNVDGSPVREDAGASYMDSGIALESGCIGVNAETKADLTNIVFR